MLLHFILFFFFTERKEVIALNKTKCDECQCYKRLLNL